MFDLTLFDVEKVNIQKGSIIGYVGKKNQFKVSKNVKDTIIKERLSGDTKFAKLVKFQNYIDEQKKNSIKILNKYKEKTIAGYGAARSGPTLAINFGINKYLKMIFDDHKLKRNYRNEILYNLFKIKKSLLFVTCTYMYVLETRGLTT